MAQSLFRMQRILFGRAILLTAALFAVFFQSAQANEQETLALQKNMRNWPITTVRINGQDSLAVLDTAATIALISDDYLTIEALDSETDRATRILGVGGQKVYSVTQVSSLTAGARSWQDVPAAVNTEDTFPLQLNILPISLFRSSIIDFDFPRSRLKLYDGQPKFVRGSRKSVIGYTETAGLMFIPIKINGVRGMALIDTGADISFVNTAYAADARGRRQNEEKKSVHGSDLESNAAVIYSFRDLEFGKNRVDKFSIPVVQTDLFRELGFEEGPMMVIGMDVLQRFRLQVDLDRKRLTFLH